MSHKELIDLLAKRLSGNISPEEQQELNGLLQDADTTKVEQQVDQMWRDTANLRPGWNLDTHAEWSKLKSRVQKTDQTNQGSGRLINLRFGLQMAAAIVVLIGIGVGVYLGIYTESTVEFRTSQNQRTQVILPDGSQVWLNQSSVLSYRSGFGEQDRKVNLIGEAFFEVQGDPDRPFKVITRGVKTEVLGTSFNLKAYEDLASVVLTVKSGTVSFASIQAQDRISILEAQSSAIFNRATGEITKIADNNSNSTAWRSRKLEFNNTRLKSVLPILEEYFGVKIKTSTPRILNCQITTKSMTQP